MRELATILLALVLFLVVHTFLQLGTRKLGRAIGKGIGFILRPPLRAVLTKYYRRKVIRQLQENRQKQGVPPLENPDIP